ncbi:MAG TPA: hypothetical protein VLS89_19715, partial [Candidatus Nanopelagicales bacterium]|nr:hypothetical protein [Candidatus Nanopelagicales bacterium]
DHVGNRQACVPGGTLPVGSACEPKSDQCAPGLVCAPSSPTTAICLAVCTTDADCEGGVRCLQRLVDQDTGMVVPGVQLCHVDCDIVKDTGCPAGMMCQPGVDTPEYYKRCLPEGPGMQGVPCSGFLDCASTFGCVGTPSGQSCSQYCVLGAGGCPGSLSCTPFSPGFIEGGVEYGYCSF